MNAAESPNLPGSPNTEPEPIPLFARAMLALFLLGFLFFGMMLAGDLISGLFRQM